MRYSPTIRLVSILLLVAAAGSQAAPPRDEAERGPSAAGAGSLAAQTLILFGDPSPDGNGTVGGFGYPTINNKGEVAVVLSFNNTQSPPLDFSGIFLFSAQSATTLVRGGDPSPDGNGLFEYFGYEPNFPEQVVVNDNGSVAFAAYLD
ncbi:MAG: hypothetical protein P8Y44_02625, partial [Acidobacteriota bacterium]